MSFLEAAQSCGPARPLSTFSGTVNVLDAIELCLVLHDVESVLNLHGDALYHALQARALLDGIADPRAVSDRERYQHYQVNVVRAFAVAFHNLKLSRAAYDACLEADARAVAQKQLNLWRPHIVRDAINALSQRPRFALSTVEGLADRARAVAGQDDATSPLWELLLDRSLGRAYLRYGNLKKARRVLRDQLDALDRTAVLGPLHRVSVLSTVAELHWIEGDRSAWQQ